MKASLESLLAMILRPALGLFGRQGVQADVAVEPLLRAELFSVEQMDRHGNFLAASHKIDPAHLPDRLRARLRENEGVLLNALSLLTHAVRENDRISPAGEWLLDNAYLIEEQIRTKNLSVATVLSGNRNFEARIHPLAKANFLASPPLVVAYAIAGSVLTDLSTEALGTGTDGQPV